MQRSLLIWILVCLTFPLMGQEYVHRDYYGQGTTDAEALEALMGQIGRAVSFENPALLQTYKADIGRAAVAQIQNGKVLFSLSGAALDAVFQARQIRSAAVLDEGRKATDDAVRKIYYIWAWYYLSSLPQGHQLPGKEQLKQWLLVHKELEPARLQVPMTHIEREVSAIRSLVGDIFAPVQEKVENTVRIIAPPSPAESVAEHRHEGLETVPSGVPEPMPVAGPRLPVGPVALPPQAVRLAPKEEVFPFRVQLQLTLSRSPEWVPGILLQMGKRWGGVAFFQTSLRRTHATVQARSDGRLIGAEGYIWPDGESRVSHVSLCAGPSYAFKDWLGAYLLAGYGDRTVFWKDSEGQWVRIQDISSRGLSVGGGLLFAWKHFSASIGLLSVNFATLGVFIGLGAQF